MVGSSRPSGAGDDSRMSRMQDAVRKLISGIGEDLEREGLRDTPKVGLGQQRVLEHLSKQHLSCVIAYAEGCQSLHGDVCWVSPGCCQVRQVTLTFEHASELASRSPPDDAAYSTTRYSTKRK